MSEKLVFEEAEHRYYVGGKPVPNVTGILSGLTDYSMIPPAILDLARQKGVATHKMVELHCRDDLDEDELPEWMLPILAAWKEFAERTGFEMLESEFRVFHPVYKYAGTGDLFGHMKHAGDFAFIDIKRSLLAGDAIGMQIAAYKEAYCASATLPNVKQAAKRASRYALRLSEKGPPRLQAYTNQNDFNDFLTCLSYSRLLEKHNP